MEEHLTKIWGYQAGEISQVQWDFPIKIYRRELWVLQFG